MQSDLNFDYKYKVFRQKKSVSSRALIRIGKGHHGFQGPQGLGLARILQNRKRRRQAADVAATVAALPGKKWQWRPCGAYGLTLSLVTLV